MLLDNPYGSTALELSAQAIRWSNVISRYESQLKDAERRAQIQLFLARLELADDTFNRSLLAYKKAEDDFREASRRQAALQGAQAFLELVGQAHQITSKDVQSVQSAKVTAKTNWDMTYTELTRNAQSVYELQVQVRSATGVQQMDERAEPVRVPPAPEIAPLR
jgi:hypothetical protein